ncbi:MAG: putative Zn-dependent protease [Myxococcota bacterium]|jgi:predicted Zn-dependent protease
MTRVLILAALAAMLIPATSSARTYPHETAKVEVTIPDAWKVEADDDVLSATSADEMLGLVFTVLPAAAIDEALDQLDKELASFITDMEPDGKPSEVTINGMKGITIDGKGKIEGVAMDIGLMILEAPSGKVVMVLGFAAKGTMDKHERAVQGIFKSLKPTK